MRYIPHCQTDIDAMLKKIGVNSVDELFDQIPESLRCKGPLNLPEPLSEAQLQAHINGLAATEAMSKSSFMGGGIYHHHVASAVDQLLLRSEFYTAYTPYQPEISQGTLQAIFEFQTMICQLFDMNIANASMYDGATALVEGALMARRVTKRNKIVVSQGIHPEYLETLRTYINALDNDAPNIHEVPLEPQTGQTHLDKLRESVDNNTACVLVGYPNFFGVVEPLDQIVAISQAQGARIVSSTSDPYAFGVIVPPGTLGVDIATGEGQCLGVPPAFGGPGVGLFSIKQDKKLLRQMPGRLVGKTVDTQGKEGFVLTLSTREQHIRREKATSNICTNHGLCALAVGIHLSLLGQNGFKQTADACLAKTQYLKTHIAQLDTVRLLHTGPTFNEFAVSCTNGSASDALAKLEKSGFLGGVDLGRFSSRLKNAFLIAVTETISKETLDEFIQALKTI